MATSKTRMQIVNVARELFAKQGVEATTMNDIAVASGKGRRTLYTYFKNKDDVYCAVIEEELDRMSERLRVVAAKNIEPEDKLVQLIYTHLSLIREAVLRNGTLRAEFFRDIWRVEQARKNFDKTEVELITKVLMQGIRKGKFDVANIRLSVDIIHYCVKGLEIPYIYGRLGDGMGAGSSRPLVQQIIHRAMARIERPDEIMN
ncbi:MAG: TetR/AcrR family transcriptional regulator [Bacteroidaceae bacterium]|nr:TetR/AcrR family transcriptional regulator [Bacteroidaceae bacterium]